MKRLFIATSLFAVLGLSAMIWTACSSNPSKAGAADGQKTEADTTEVASKAAETVDPAEQAPALNFTVYNLMDLVTHYGNSELAEKSGLTFIYNDTQEDGEVDDIQIVYGFDVEKAQKEALGYSLKVKSPHACYFQVDLDTSTRLGLYFASKDDAKAFHESLKAQKPFDYEDETFYIHPMTRSDGVHYLAVDVPYGDDQYETRYVIYQPEEKGSFCYIEIEPYV